MARCRNAVAVDGEGNVVAAGFIVNAEIASGGPGGIMFARPFTVIKFNGATGQSLAPGHQGSTTSPFFAAGATAVALDARGNVVAAGSTSRDFTVVKFSRKLTTVDFDGDGSTDITVYRDGMWYVIRSLDSEQTPVGWGGLSQDIAVPWDYDGDGKIDQAVYRDGVWWILRLSDGCDTGINWGLYEPILVGRYRLFYC